MPTRKRLSWSGRKPDGAVVRALDEVGLALGKPREPADLAVHAGDSPEPAARPWVWVPGRTVTVDDIRNATAAGALDIVGPMPPAALAARLRDRLADARVPATEVPATPGFVATSAAARALLTSAAQAARTSMPVLLTGETGTGKEMIARLIHEWSRRSSKRFVPINCAAIPNDLLESELFGYAPGAFSGAGRGYDGQLAAAEGGTVFLDEIDDTPPSFQVKLLRVLEDRVVSRLGENTWRKVDFRIMAATNRDLRGLIRDGVFLPDLYERLAIVSLEVPPLRKRTEDVRPLVLELVRRYYAEEPDARRRHQVDDVTPEALAVLTDYGWPGNVRELRNVIFEALVHKRSGTALLPSDLPPRLYASRPVGVEDTACVNVARIEAALGAGFSLRKAIEELERAALSAALRRAGGNAAGAARLLGDVGRGQASDPGATVRAMMKRLGVSG